MSVYVKSFEQDGVEITIMVHETEEGYNVTFIQTAKSQDNFKHPKLRNILVEDECIECCVRTICEKGYKNGIYSRENYYMLDNKCVVDNPDWETCYELRDLSPFQKPQRISDQMCDFLGLEHGSKLSRADLTIAVTKYIYSNGKEEGIKKMWADKMNPNGRDLRDPDDRSVILPDEALSEVLDYQGYVDRVKAGEVTWKRRYPNTEIVQGDISLTYPILQHLLAKHFRKHKK